MNKDNASDIQKQASEIIVAAYKNGGRVKYKYVKDNISADIDSINKVLQGYGKFNVLYIDGSWDTFELNLSNFRLADKNIPDLFKKKKRGVWGKIGVGIFTGVSVYFVIQLILWIAERIR